MIAELFLPPIQGQEARAAPNSTIIINATIKLLNPPPETMCVKDKAPVSFSYMISVYFVTDTGNKPASGEGITGSFNASAKLGSLSSTTWPVSGSKGSGVASAVYTAKKKGEEQITITSSGFPFSGKTISFEVVECNWDIKLKAYEVRTYDEAEFRTNIDAKGGIAVTDDDITGGGTFKYKLTVDYKNPNPKELQCEVSKTLEAESTIKIEGAPVGDGDLMFTIYIIPFDNEAIEFRCEDKEGTVTKATMLPAGYLDPNKDTKLKNLLFKSGQTKKSFTFGHGGGDIWLVKRKQK
jgi:hypothetical protein